MGVGMMPGGGYTIADDLPGIRESGVGAVVAGSRVHPMSERMIELIVMGRSNVFIEFVNECTSLITSLHNQTINQDESMM